MAVITTKVVNCKSKNYDVYIGRYSFGSVHYGNPFRIGADGDREEVIKMYEEWLRGTKHTGVEPGRRLWVLKNLCSLKHRTLGCYCAPESCHGDVLVKLIKELC